MNWVRIPQIRRRNVRWNFLRTGFIGLSAAVVNLLGPLAKGHTMSSEAESSTGSISRRHVWLWTGSKTTKRGAELRWQGNLRCGSGRTEESAVRERLDGYR